MSWKTSETITNLASALVDAVAMLSDVPKNHQAKIETKGGGSYGYKYADLADAVAMIRPIMNANGLAVLQNASGGDGSIVSITTIIIHRSGEWIEFAPLEMPSGRTAQETGSAITYGRRYALLACLGLAADDDDGANAARFEKSDPKKRPSREEMTRVVRTDGGGRVIDMGDRPSAKRPATEAQKTTLRNMMIERGMSTDDENWDELTAADASDRMTSLKGIPRVK